ncbi:hypothetical protein I5M27_07190 [Adhaeribacter sp. BT258]|uniref:Lipoprotein n=1 Tax=Adhaeribacter terrigena TaxID=2793070 RepID=A0ABS1C092_9BACT|nr:hypothetical protein [Adhaeribacter terrigena]MBK0402765.1 hypothetical protein [Adhaeribacter terrigena]
MKKLLFLPVAVIMLLSGCEKRIDQVKPASTTEQSSNLKAGLCPTYLSIDGINGMAFLSEVVNCPVYTCDGYETLYYTYTSNSPVHSSNTSSNLYAADVNAIRIKSNDVANQYMPKGCSGVIIPRYRYLSKFDNSTHQLDIYVIVDYYCCVPGQID